ncbi:BZIP domain-containing protein [Trichoderma simmonsii]|uniref:BZIP domain-containing protein n=1 Tax=Trichoderma simmonsii TaxID=1491479 RepID=A0A8G0LQE2_9HYPO|nr:BZIP domain-containing protein [Trichoderma simmonsii]
MRSHGQGGNSQNKNDYNDKKKVRNRLSQQAFRRRRAENLKTLQDRLNSSYKPQNETIARLEEENRNLRMQLVEVQAQLSRFAVNTQLLNDSVSRALNPNPPSHDVAHKDAQSQLNITSESPSDGSYNLDEPLDISSVQSAIPFHIEAPVSDVKSITDRPVPIFWCGKLPVLRCLRYLSTLKLYIPKKLGGIKLYIF